MVQVTEVRRRCRIEARRFGFSERLFDRIPIYIFRYFMSDDPMISTQPFTQMDIMTVFMLINEIDAGLMMAFYNVGGQQVEMLFELHRIFSAMWRLYRSNQPDDLLSVFGNFYSFHLESRTLRRVDMSIVTYAQQDRESFVPNAMNWRRWREVRQLIRANSFRVNDDYDLLEVREALRGGLLQRGRHH